eukprot:5902000-Prymnesium_polylepis.1
MSHAKFQGAQERTWSDPPLPPQHESTAAGWVGLPSTLVFLAYPTSLRHQQCLQNRLTARGHDALAWCSHWRCCGH